MSTDRTPLPYVALLRGVNVGGNNRIAMKDLAALFTEAGCTSVRTYIQSGNVVFKANAALAKRIAAIVTEGLSKSRGLTVPVVLRSGAALAECARENPFLAEGADPATLHIGFLADLPDAAQKEALDPNRSPPDRFALRGQEVFLHCPNGLARTKLTNQYFDSKLKTTTTVRNLRTVRQLIQMCEETS